MHGDATPGQTAGSGTAVIAAPVGVNDPVLTAAGEGVDSPVLEGQPEVAVGGEPDKMSMILAVVSLLFAIGMVVLLAMMDV